MNPMRLFILLPLLVLTACGGDARSALGLGREAPDEFVVVSRPPLSMPPDFSLEAPDATKQGPSLSTRDQARDALLGTGDKQGSALSSADAGWGSLLNGATPSDGLKSEFELQKDGTELRRAPAASVTAVESSSVGSAAESRLLNQMGADKADGDIRTKLGQDARAEPEAKAEAKSLYESMIGADKAEPVLDPKGEAERLRTNKDAGKKPNEGKIVTEDQKKSKSVLDVLF